MSQGHPGRRVLGALLRGAAAPAVALWLSTVPAAADLAAVTGAWICETALVGDGAPITFAHQLLLEADGTFFAEGTMLGALGQGAFHSYGRWRMGRDGVITLYGPLLGRTGQALGGSFSLMARAEGDMLRLDEARRAGGVRMMVACRRG